MLGESSLQRPPSVPDVRFINIVTPDVINRADHSLFDHFVFRPHQYLSKCIGGLEVHFHPVSSRIEVVNIRGRGEKVLENVQNITREDTGHHSPGQVLVFIY